MSSYADLIYPEDSKNPYPQKLASYIYDRFMKERCEQEPDAKILDIGCCTGKALRLLKNCNNGLDLYGIDVRDEEPEDVEFKKCNLENESIPFDDNTFEFVYSKSVLEHVFNTDNYISEAMRVLKPGGIFIGLTPDWESQRKFFWDDYTHVKPFTRKGLRDCLKMHGFRHADCEYFYQLPFMWDKPALSFIPKIISLLPDSLKWKNRQQRNTMDRKIIRFSKEKMLLSFGAKPG